MKAISGEPDRSLCAWRSPLRPTAYGRGAIAGWASWRQGSREMALRSFRRARRLDPGATVIDRVLAQVSPSSSVADLKKVLPS